jgi:hypothetical protein
VKRFRLYLVLWDEHTVPDDITEEQLHERLQELHKSLPEIAYRLTVAGKYRGTMALIDEYDNMDIIYQDMVKRGL